MNRYSSRKNQNPNLEFQSVDELRAKSAEFERRPNLRVFTFSPSRSVLDTNSSTKMLRLVRPARSLLRTIPRTAAVPARALSSTPRVLGGHAAPPSLLGEGASAGSVPTDENQATGLERLQILGNLEGVDVFDMKPLEMTRLGTVENPIQIHSWVRSFVGGLGNRHLHLTVFYFLFVVPRAHYRLHWVPCRLA